jgi:hypothetical protein
VSSLFDKPSTLPAPPEVETRRVDAGVNVVVEPADEGRFWVQRMRDGMPASAMLFTRDELVELRARIETALEVG